VFGVGALLLVMLGGCTTGDPNDPSNNWYAESFPDRNASSFAPSDDPVAQGQLHLRDGNYGTAEGYFREAVEQTPIDVDAWLGLAASYDHLGRFDLADRAYAHALSLVGRQAAILNNIGYSYLLRGDFVKARTTFLQALDMEPDNPRILANLQLLDERTAHVGPNPRQPAYLGADGDPDGFAAQLQISQLTSAAPTDASVTPATPSSQGQNEAVTTASVSAPDSAGPVVIAPDAAPTVAAQPPAAPAAWGSGRYEVQIGAFVSEAVAQDKLAAAQRLDIALLRGRGTRTDQYTDSERVYHRARFTGFDRAGAREACDALRRDNIDCFVADPGA
jgi:tetratricopeptide (TPR) repeat protein